MLRNQTGGMALSGQTSLLRATLLLSLGLSPLACGGTVVTASAGEGGGSTQTGGYGAVGSTSSIGGAGSVGGASPIGGASPTGGTGSTGGTNPTTLCERPVVDPDTKLISCANGLTHRAQRVTCTFTGAGGEGGAAGAGANDAGAAGAVAEFSECATNADCASLPYGYCEDNTDFGGVRLCRSGCATDKDCNHGACICNGVNPGICVSAGCQVDADCASGSLCVLTVGVCGSESFHCTSPLDECLDSNDCVTKGGGSCSFENDHRVCDDAVCGRPFLVAEAPRMAAIETRADWLDATLSPDVRGLTPLQRTQLSAHWARLGQMEHASIAAFARFNLQLLSLGAPSDLVEACNRALADETAHARACFALASAYGGSAVGPARLDIEHCFEDTSLVAIAKLVLREGCIGETAASLEALAAAEVASDSAAKQALTRIARDELSHAELAFKFLRWTLTLASVEERHELAREAAQQLADFEHDARSGARASTDDRLAAHGLIAGDALRAIHLAAARDVTRPLLAALFDIQESSHV